MKKIATSSDTVGAMTLLDDNLILAFYHEGKISLMKC
jgi:hypothetical protein